MKNLPDSESSSATVPGWIEKSIATVVKIFGFLPLLFLLAIVIIGYVTEGIKPALGVFLTLITIGLSYYVWILIAVKVRTKFENKFLGWTAGVLGGFLAIIPVWFIFVGLLEIIERKFGVHLL
jgi:hypothetical protein